MEVPYPASFTIWLTLPKVLWLVTQHLIRDRAIGSAIVVGGNDFGLPFLWFIEVEIMLPQPFDGTPICASRLVSYEIKNAAAALRLMVVPPAPLVACNIDD